MPSDNLRSSIPPSSHPVSGRRPCYHCNSSYFHLQGCIVAMRLDREAREAAAVPVKFVAVKSTVMRGSEHIATACSHTMALRIARALNNHKTNSRGF